MQKKAKKSKALKTEKTRKRKKGVKKEKRLTDDWTYQQNMLTIKPTGIISLQMACHSCFTQEQG